ncbi:MAG: hypothetical protein ACE5DN_07660, partial [Flavobacteriales bacterium]
SLYSDMRTEAQDTLQAEGIAPDNIEFIPSMDLRYAGQYHEVPLEVRMEDILGFNLPAVEEAFHREHNRQFGYELREDGTGLEVINLRLRAIGLTEKPTTLSTANEAGVTEPEGALKCKRMAYVPEADEMRKVPVYDGDKLKGRFTVEGPAIIEQVNTTVFLGESYNCETGIGGAFVVYNKHLMPDGFKHKEQVGKQTYIKIAGK